MITNKVRKGSRGLTALACLMILACSTFAGCKQSRQTVVEELPTQTYEEAYALVSELHFNGFECTGGQQPGGSYTYWLYVWRNGGTSDRVIVFKNHSERVIYIYYGWDDNSIEENFYEQN